MSKDYEKALAAFQAAEAALTEVNEQAADVTTQIDELRSKLDELNQNKEAALAEYGRGTKPYSDVEATQTAIADVEREIAELGLRADAEKRRIDEAKQVVCDTEREVHRLWLEHWKGQAEALQQEFQDTAMPVISRAFQAAKLAGFDGPMKHFLSRNIDLQFERKWPLPNEPVSADQPVSQLVNRDDRKAADSVRAQRALHEETEQRNKALKAA